MKIEVFSSPGCSKCAHAKALLRQIISEPGMEGLEWREVNVLDELDYAVRLGVLSTPAIAVDGKLSFSALPSPQKLRDHIQQQMGAGK